MIASRPARLMAAAAREVCGAAVLTALTCVLASCTAPSPARGHGSSPRPEPSGVRTPAARTPAALTPAARTPAARTPAALTPASLTAGGRPGC